MKWHKRFIEVAELISTWSKDPSTKVGCIIIQPHTRAIVSTGYNGFPRKIEDAESRWERPIKYGYVEHAERNAVYNATRLGHSTQDCWVYLNWNPDSICVDCARALIQSGIVHVIGTKEKSIPVKPKGGWHEHRHLALAMLSEAEVEITYV